MLFESKKYNEEVKALPMSVHGEYGVIFWRARTRRGILTRPVTSIPGYKWYLPADMYAVQAFKTIERNVWEKRPKKKVFVYHPWAIIGPSPWPFFLCFSLLGFMVSLVLWLHNYHSPFEPLQLLLISLVSVIFIIGLWVRDIIRESTFGGGHTSFEVDGLKIGMASFIWLECWIFVVFFWAYFNAALTPTCELGSIWPSLGIDYARACFDDLSFFLTFVLASVSASALYLQAKFLEVGELEEVAARTYVAPVVKQLAYDDEEEKVVIKPLNFNWPIVVVLLLILIFGLTFIGLQLHSYINMYDFTINDGMYGTTFYMITGIHLVHVIVGVVLWIIVLVRYLKGHFDTHHHFGLTATVWFWHFLNGVWLVIMLAIYYWGSNPVGYY